jgi:hypothetical protein
LFVCGEMCELFAQKAGYRVMTRSVDQSRRKATVRFEDGKARMQCLSMALMCKT